MIKLQRGGEDEDELLSVPGRVTDDGDILELHRCERM